MNPIPEGPGLLLIAGLACLVVGACFFVAFLITATRAALSRAGAASPTTSAPGAADDHTKR